MGESVADGKTLISSAITKKGINTSNTATFSVMANNIANIQTGTINSLSVQVPAGTPGVLEMFIKFPKPFTYVPRVLFRVTRGADNMNCSARNVNTTGFFTHIENNHPTAIRYQEYEWIAI